MNDLWFNITSLCFSAGAFVIAFVCLIYTIKSKNLASIANKLSSLSAMVNEKDKTEILLNECIGKIRDFIYDCNKVCSLEKTDYKELKEANDSVYKGFIRLRSYALANNNYFLRNISCLKVDGGARKLRNKELFARLISSLMREYLALSKSGNVTCENANKYGEMFTNLYTLMYEHLELANRKNKKMKFQFYSSVAHYYNESVTKGLIKKYECE